MSGSSHRGTEPDDELEKLKKQCRRFRVLIIGKANAGKTTIIERICNSKESDARIWSPLERKEIDPATLKGTNARGYHNVEHEITFKGNPGFVFHDSCGFEAGSKDELSKVRNFIKSKATGTDLSKQLHAIWYCLPVDGNRPLSDGEMEFFKEGCGRVPVIAVFTKFDGLITKEYNRLLESEADDDGSIPDLLAMAEHSSQQMFEQSEHFLKKVMSAPFPPTRFICTQDMNEVEENSGCSSLIEATVASLGSESLRSVLISVQESNIQLKVSQAIQRLVRGYSWPTDASATDVYKKTWIWFPHLQSLRYFLFFDEESSSSYELSSTAVNFLETDLNFYTPENDVSPFHWFLHNTISSVIVANDSFWHKKKTQKFNLKIVFDEYINSGRQESVHQELMKIEAPNILRLQANRVLSMPGVGLELNGIADRAIDICLKHLKNNW